MHATRTTPSSVDLWTPAQTAHEFGVSIRTLATWRSTGRHALPYVKVGRLVRYHPADVNAWLQARKHG